jgi:hypothetical protein
MHSLNEDSMSCQQREALLTEIKETNWNPEEGEGTDTGGS